MMQRQEGQVPVANKVEGIEKNVKELQGILLKGINALKIKKKDTFCQELAQFLEEEIKNNKLSEIQETLTGLKEDIENDFLQEQMEEELQELAKSIKEKYHDVEAKQSAQTNASIRLNILKKLLTCLTPAISLGKKITSESMHNLFHEELTALARDINPPQTDTDEEPEANGQERQPITCFISYAWGVKEHQQLAVRLYEDLKKAGIQATIDEWNNRASSSINYFTEEVLAVDYVVLMGSRNLLRKYDEDKEIYQKIKTAREAGDNETVRRLEQGHRSYLVNQELDMILARKGSNPFAILPVLVDGSLRECLPPEFSRTVPVYFTEWEDEKRYCWHVFEVLEHLLITHKAIVARHRDVFLKLLENAGELPADVIKQLEDERQQKLATDRNEAKGKLIGAARQAGEQANVITITAPAKPQPTARSTRLFGPSGGVSASRNIITEDSRLAAYAVEAATTLADDNSLQGGSEIRAVSGTTNKTIIELERIAAGARAGNADSSKKKLIREPNEETISEEGGDCCLTHSCRNPYLKLYPLLQELGGLPGQAGTITISQNQLKQTQLTAIASTMNIYGEIRTVKGDELYQLLAQLTHEGCTDCIDDLFHQAKRFIHTPSPRLNLLQDAICYLVAAYDLSAQLEADKKREQVNALLLSALNQLASNLPYQETVLHYFTRIGSVNVCRYLLMLKPKLLANFDINAIYQGLYKRTALQIAVDNNRIEITQLLLNAGADITVGAHGKSAKTVLHLAAEKGHKEIVDLLLSHPSIKQILDTQEGEELRSDGYTALHRAAKGGYLCIVEKLIRAGVNTEIISSVFKKTAVESLIEEAKVTDHLEHDRLVCLLLDKKESSFFTSLRQYIISTAIDQALIHTAKVLIEKSSFLQTLGDSRKTFLETAAVAMLKDSYSTSSSKGISLQSKQASYVEFIKWLIEKGANPNERFIDYTGYLLHISGEVGSFELIDFLLQKRIDVTLCDRSQNTILHTAASCLKRDFADSIKLLLEKHPTLLNEKNNDNRLALHLAAGRGNAAAVAVLLTACRNQQVNVVDNQGNTPIQLALMLSGLQYNTRSAEDYLAVLDLLLKAGADLTHVNQAGKTCQQLAADSSDPRVPALLATFISETQQESYRLEQLVAKLRQQLPTGIDREEQRYYIAVRGCQYNYDNSFDLYNEISDKLGEVNKYLESNKRSLLLLGNAGAGKTMFCQYLFLKLQKKYTQPNDPIVLYIMLGTISDPAHDLIETYLKRLFPDIQEKEIHLLKSQYRFVFILDGYDEMSQEKGLYQNLYALNKLGEWDAKVIFSCRSSYLINVKNYERHFYPTIGAKTELHHFTEINLLPFSDEQITAYINQFLQFPPEELGLEAEWRDPGVYQRYIDQLPGLKLLLTTPFLLRVLMEALPLVVQAYENSPTDKKLILTESKLYDYFIEGYFNRQADKLLVQGKLPSDGSDVVLDYKEFAKKLAICMWKKKVTYVTYRQRSTLFDSEEEAAWDFLLGNSNPAMVRAREGCPLKRLEDEDGVKFAFLNYALQDYFVSLEMYEQELKKHAKKKKQAYPEQDNSLFSKQTNTFFAQASQQRVEASRVANGTSSTQQADDEISNDQVEQELPPLLSDEEYVRNQWQAVKDQVVAIAAVYGVDFINASQENMLTISIRISDDINAWNNLATVQETLKALEGYVGRAMEIFIEQIIITENKLQIIGIDTNSTDKMRQLLQEIGFKFSPTQQIGNRL